MAISQQQKVDFLLKKIGYTKTKTGLAVDSSLSGTKKAGFAEALPSPLIIADTSLWTESGLIPTTPPGSDSSQVKVYLAGSSGLRLTVDSTVAGNRAFLAYTTYNNTSSARLTNWIDTQFGNDYLIKVYKGDPNSGGVALSASGSGANDGWFFDYSAGVLNFNDTNVPSGVTGTNIYIVGYRYIGNTGAPTPGDDFSFQDLTVTRNLSVAGLSTFTGLIDANGGITATTGTFEDLGGTGRIVFNSTSGSGGKLVDSANLSYVTGTNTLNVVNLIASASIDLNGDLDVDGHTNLDNVNIAGVTTASHLTVLANTNLGNSSTDVVTITGNVDLNGDIDVDGHTTLDNLTVGGATTISSTLKVTSNIDANGDLDVDGHTNLDNVSISGVTTAAGAIDLNADLDVDGHTNLDNVSIAGVTTAAGNIVANGNIVGDNATNISGINLVTAATLDISGDVDIDGHTNLDNVSVAGVTTFTGSITANGAIDLNADLDVDGHTNLDNVNVSGVTTFAGTVNTASIVATGIDLNGDIDVDGHTNLDNVSISGVTTAAGAIDLNADLDVDGHTNLDNVSIAGVTTFGSNSNPLLHVDINADLDLYGSGGITSCFWDKSDNALKFLDSAKLRFGTNNDCLIYHNDDSFYLNNSKGDLKLRTTAPGDDIEIKSADDINILVAGGEDGIKVIGDGAVQLFFDDVKKIETAQTGAIVTGVLTATTFSGAFNGSSVTASGDIDANGNLDVDGQTDLDVLNVAETATFSALVDINSDLDVDGHTNLDNVSIAGVTTAAGAIDLNADLDVDGHTNLDNVSIAGVTTAAGAIDLNADLDVDGHTNLDNVSIAGVVTATGNIVANGSIDLAGDIDVEGHTNLDNLSVAGVTTTAGLLDINAGANASTLRVEDLTSGRVVLAGAGGEIQDNANLTFNGSNLTVGGNVIAADGNFSGNVTIGGTLTYEDVQNVDAVGLVTAREGIDVNARGINIDAGGLNVVAGISTFNANIDANANIDIARDLNVDGHTNLDNVSIAGVTTFSNNTVFSSSLDLNADLDVDGHTNLDNVSIAGVTTATGNIVANGSIDLAGDIDVDGHTNLDNVSIAGVTTAAGAIDLNADLYVSGVSNFEGTIIGAPGVDLRLGGNIITSGITTLGVTTVTNLTSQQLNVSGVSTFSSNINLLDGISAKFGTDLDGEIKHTGNNLQIQEATGNIQITNYANDKDVDITSDDGSGGTALYFKADGSTGETILYNYGSEKIKTTSTGVSITGNNVISGDLDVDGQTSLDHVTVAGVSTFTGTSYLTNIVSTGSIDLSGDIDVDGHTNLDNLSVAGVSTFASTVKVDAQLTVDSLRVTDDGSGNPIVLIATDDQNPSALRIKNDTYHSNTSTGFSIKQENTGSFNLTGKGNSEFVPLKIRSQDGSSSKELLQWDAAGNATFGYALSVAGVSTFTGAIDANGDLDVDGHTNLDNVSVAGVTTFTGAITANGSIDLNADLDVDGHTNLDNVSISGVATATSLTIDDYIYHSGDTNTFIGFDANDTIVFDTNGSTKLKINSSGHLILSDDDDTYFNRPSNDTLAFTTGGSQRLSISSSGINVTGSVVATGADINGDIDVDGHTNLDNVSVAGVSTFTGGITANGAIDLNADLDVDGHTNLDNVSITGVTTFIGNIGGTATFQDIDVDGHTNLDNVSIAGVTTTTGMVDISGGSGSGSNLTLRNSSAIVNGEDIANINIVANDGPAGYSTGAQIKFEANGSWTGDRSRTDIIFRHNSNASPTTLVDALRINAIPTNVSNNVSIGHSTSSASDTYYLSIKGYERSSEGANGDTVNIGIINQSQDSSATANIDFRLGQAAASNTTSAQLLAGKIGGWTNTSSTRDGYFAINVSENSALTERFRIKSNGYTGINTNNPLATLHVQGSQMVTGDIDVDGHTNLDNVSIAGVTTAAGAIDLNADLDVDGHTNLDNVSISGVSTLTTLRIGNTNDITSILDEDNFASNSATALPTQQSVKAYVDTNITAQDLDFQADSGGALNIDLDSEVLSVVGTSNEIETAGSGNQIQIGLPNNVTIGNQLTVTGAIDANGDLDVDGHTNLDNVSIAGVTTFSGALDINAGVNISGVGDFAASTFNNIRLAYSGDNEIDTSSGNLILDSAGGTVEVTDNLTVSGAIAAAGAIDANGDLDVDGHTNLDNVSVAGVTTFTGAITANGSIDLNADLDVDGHTNLDNVSIAGVTTFATTAEFDGTAKFDSTITAGGATGSNGQYLKATGSGVAWASFPTLRTTNVQTATAGQTTFSFSYNASFLDVFVNGTKLTPSEYTASNGTSIVLDIGCFVGDIVEFYSYQTTPGAGGGIPDVVSDTSPELGGTLDLNGNTISGTGHINVTGNLKVSGMTTTAAISLGGHIIPTVHNTYDIGNASFKIRDIYEQNGSDERIKEDIVPFTGGLDFVNQIPVVSFTFKDIDYNEYTRGKRETGFIAQDIKRALDNSTYESYRLWSENPDSYQGLDKKQLIPALVSAIQELTARVEELENK